MRTNNNFHILIVDDEPFNIDLAEAYLSEEGYQLSFAENAKMTFQLVKQEKIDLILLDINMPGKDGFEVCESLKADPKTKDIAIIFLTAQTDVAYISRAFEVGGADYLSKPFFGLELKARVHTQLQKVDYLDELKHKQSKLAHLTITDPLTKLHNALYFDSQIKTFQTKKEDFWFLYIKIDRFEKINEIYGFYGANKIIRRLSKLLEALSFKNSVVAKLYGVSFGVLVKDYAYKDIKKLYDLFMVSVMKDKELGKLITLSTVIYTSKESKDALATIYKKLNSAMHTLEREGQTKLSLIK